MCLELMYDGFFTNETVCLLVEVASESNSSHIFMRMVVLVEMNSHRVSPAVVFDSLFMIIQSKSLFVR